MNYYHKKRKAAECLKKKTYAGPAAFQHSFLPMAFYFAVPPITNCFSEKDGNAYLAVVEKRERKQILNF